MRDHIPLRTLVALLGDFVHHLFEANREILGVEYFEAGSVYARFEAAARLSQCAIPGIISWSQRFQPSGPRWFRRSSIVATSIVATSIIEASMRRV